MSLPKSERLKSRKDIDLLYNSRRSYRTPVLRLLYKWVEVEQPSQKILFTATVPKKLVKKAVNRNYIKRRIIEAYRLNNHILTSTPEGRQLHLMAIYLVKQNKKSGLVDYKTIERDVISLLSRLNT